MTDHLSSPILNALADGELSVNQLAVTTQHLVGCPLCTSNALYQILLKSATAKAGQRYAPPPDLRRCLARQIRQDVSPGEASNRNITLSARWGFSFYGWVTAFAMLLVCAGILFVDRNTSRPAMISSEFSAIAAEACDQHIAALAAIAPEVISSDRHTVKPWFQGKLPFSFNLPENLAVGTTLDGANLTYIHNRPAAQLLYSIGNHRVSVYLEQRTSAQLSTKPVTDHSGFHVISFSTDEIDGFAVSDVDLARLLDLVSRIKQDQE